MKKTTIKTSAIALLAGALLLVILFPSSYLASKKTAQNAVRRQLQAVKESGRELLTVDLTEFGLPARHACPES